MTNANDPIQSLAWVKSEDGVPELNTTPNGLTKREYFAAMAMQGLTSNSDWVKSMNVPDDWDEYASRLASASADLADALITALNTNP